MVDFTSRYPRSSSSFSSSLLDAIYRSIDQEEEDELVIYRQQSTTKTYREEEEEAAEMANFRRARMIENWMEEKVTEKVVVMSRKSTPEISPISQKDRNLDSFSLSSSNSGAGAGDSFQIQRPKPVRTAVPSTVGEILAFNRRGYEAEQRTPKRGNGDGGLLKKKSRALKLYAELKKVKQPISPGGKLAGLLNSLFAGGGGAGTTNSKKPKIISDLDSMKSSTCSSASSFSRSCLSNKTPSSRGKSSEKRSVRFSPVSVIFNDDEFRLKKAEQSDAKMNDGVEEMVREIVEKYHHHQRKNEAADFPIDHMRNWEEDDEDDVGSCGSSDLFELDNLPKWGIEELPVYETTNISSSKWLR